MIAWRRVFNTLITPFSTSKQLWQKLRQISIGQASNIVDAGVVQNCNIDEEKQVTISIKTSKDFRRIKSAIIDSLSRQGYTKIDVQLVSEKTKSFQKHGNLSSVKNLLSVTGAASRTAFAFEFARTLAKKGLKTGMLECSLNSLALQSKGNAQRQSVEAAHPVQISGVQCMFPELLSGKTLQPALLPTRMLLNTQWSSLDYLVVNASSAQVQTPTLSQLKWKGGILVSKATEPQNFVADLRLLTELRINLLGTVLENEINAGGSKSETALTKQSLKSNFGINVIAVATQNSINLSQSELRQNSIQAAQELDDFASNCLAALSNPPSRYYAHYNTTTQKLEIVLNGKTIKKIKPFDLRYSPQEQADSKHLDPEVFPSRIRPLDRTAIQVGWSDGKHPCFYSFQRLLAM